MNLLSKYRRHIVVGVSGAGLLIAVMFIMPRTRGKSPSFEVDKSRAVLLRAEIPAAPAPSRLPEITSSGVTALGAFLSVKHYRAAGDTTGYQLQLWRQANRLYGMLSVYVGPDGDPPTGLLEKVQYDPRSGKLSFTARLSTGQVIGDAQQAVPSRDVFEFDGRLARTQVSGVLKMSSLVPAGPSKSKKITLTKSNTLTQTMEDKPSYEEWKKSTDAILARLGPKW